MKDIILGLIRHLLTAAGGALATKGVISADDSATVETIVGSAIAIAGGVWSIVAKKKAPKTPPAV